MASEGCVCVGGGNEYVKEANKSDHQSKTHL
jgi:hypothetical protein